MANLGLSQAANNFVNMYTMRKQDQANQAAAAKNEQIKSLMGSMLMGNATPEQTQQLAQAAPDQFVSAQNYLQSQQAQQAAQAQTMSAEEDERDLTYLMSTDDTLKQDEYLKNRIATIEERGGDATDSKFLLNMPESQRKNAIQMIAKRAGIDPLESAKSGVDIGTYNPRDYTVDSFAKFVNTQDPAVLKRYAPMKQSVVGGVTYFADDSGQLFLPVVQNKDGSVTEATEEQIESGEAKPSQISAEEQIKSTASLEGAKKTATAQAAADVAASSPEALNQAAKNEAFRADTISVIDSILGSDFDKVTGTAGKIPTFMPKTEDILVKADRLESLLTAENMDIMTGVLSETDIKIISNLAGGFGLERNEKGKPVRIKGSADAFKDRMEIVKKGLHAVEIVPLLSEEIPEPLDGMIVTDSETGYKFVFKNGKWVAK